MPQEGGSPHEKTEKTAGSLDRPYTQASGNDQKPKYGSIAGSISVPPPLKERPTLARGNTIAALVENEPQQRTPDRQTYASPRRQSHPRTHELHEPQLSPLYASYLPSSHENTPIEGVFPRQTSSSSPTKKRGRSPSPLPPARRSRSASPGNSRSEKTRSRPRRHTQTADSGHVERKARDASPILATRTHESASKAPHSNAHPPLAADRHQGELPGLRSMPGWKSSSMPGVRPTLSLSVSNYRSLPPLPLTVQPYLRSMSSRNPSIENLVSPVRRSGDLIRGASFNSPSNSFFEDEEEQRAMTPGRAVSTSAGLGSCTYAYAQRPQREAQPSSSEVVRTLKASEPLWGARESAVRSPLRSVEDPVSGGEPARPPESGRSAGGAVDRQEVPSAATGPAPLIGLGANGKTKVKGRDASRSSARPDGSSGSSTGMQWGDENVRSYWMGYGAAFRDLKNGRGDVRLSMVQDGRAEVLAGTLGPHSEPPPTEQPTSEAGPPPETAAISLPAAAESSQAARPRSDTLSELSADDTSAPPFLRRLTHPTYAPFPRPKHPPVGVIHPPPHPLQVHPPDSSFHYVEHARVPFGQRFHHQFTHVHPPPYYSPTSPSSHSMGHEGFGYGLDRNDSKVRKRQLISCYPCRKRKLRCDGRRPVCEQCERRKVETQCGYAESVKRRGRGKPEEGGEEEGEGAEEKDDCEEEGDVQAESSRDTAERVQKEEREEEGDGALDGWESYHPRYDRAHQQTYPLYRYQHHTRYHSSGELSRSNGGSPGFERSRFNREGLGKRQDNVDSVERGREKKAGKGKGRAEDL